jgi:hypothetical protein
VELTAENRLKSKDNIKRDDSTSEKYDRKPEPKDNSKREDSTSEKYQPKPEPKDNIKREDSTSEKYDRKSRFFFSLRFNFHALLLWL